MKDEPLSYEVLVRDIPAAGKHVHIDADEAQRERLAEVLDLAAIAELTADLDLRPVAGRAFSVRGSLRAVVVQTDVVTLDPVAQDVLEPIEVTLMPEESIVPKARKDVLVDVGEENGPDLYRNGRIDLGVIVSEHLALGLDPYPRAAETEFAGHVEDGPASNPSPFAALARLKGGGE
jgi:hypothetical protein